METQNNETVLTINDLTVLKQIIELAQTRGAFQANELSAVGAAFDKLSNFLEVVVSEAQAQAGTEQADSGDATSEKQEPTNETLGEKND